MEYANRVAKGALIVFIMYFLGSILGYAFRIIVARNLTPAEYGLFYAVLSFIMFFTIFYDFGIGAAVVRFIPAFQAKKRLDLIKSTVSFTFIFQFVISFLFALTFFLISNWLAVNYFHNENAATMLKIFSLVFWIFSFNIFTACLQGFQKIFAFSSINVIKMSVVVALTSILLFLGFGVLAPTYAYLVAHIVIAIISVLLFFRSFPNFFKIRAEASGNLIKKLFRFGVPVTLASFSNLIISYTDTLMLTYFKPLSDVALYNVAMPLAMTLLWFLAHPLSAILLPMSSEMWTKGHKVSLQKGLEKIHKYTILGIIPLAFIFIAFPEVVIRILFGQEYVGANHVLQILSIGMIFYSIGFINSNVLSGIGKPDVTTKAVIFAAILNVVLNFAFIPMFGISGAALATAISYFAITFITTWKLKKHVRLAVDVPYFLKTLMIGIAMVAVMFFAKNFLSLNYLLEAIIILASAILVYAAMIFWFDMVDFKEVFKLFLGVMGKK